MQNAFSAGPLQASLPAISAGEPLVGILLGILVFGDRIQITPGELAIQAGGIAALVVGVILVGRAPALSQLRSWTPPSLPHTIPHTLPHGLHARHSAREEDEPDGGQPANGQSLNPQRAFARQARPRRPPRAEAECPGITRLTSPRGRVCRWRHWPG